jgi:predicted nucleic acid-binding Zn ribbon protein
MATCRECGAGIYGRSDKVFCGDACRNAFNNNKRSKRDREAAIINRILIKNKNILQSIVSQGRRNCKREELQAMGFNFNYATSFMIKEGGKIIVSCYNFSYVNSSNGRVYISSKIILNEAK